MVTDNPFATKRRSWMTFCMPVHNEQRRVKDAILSVMNQDYENTELIVVDDGSTDNSLKEIKKAMKEMTEDQLDRFTLIEFEENQGACQARNAAIAEGRGDYFMFLPADAWMYPGRVRFLVAALDDKPEIDFIYGAYRFIPHDRPFGQSMDSDEGIYPSKAFDPYTLETTNYIDGTFPLRRGLLEKMAEWNTKHYGEEMGAWDPNIKSLQDWDFWLNAVKQHGAVGEYVPDVFFETEFPEKTGLSGDSNRNWIERLNTVKEKHGIPKRKTCVVSLGGQFHGINIAKMLNANFSANPGFKPHEYETMYVVGMYPQFINEIYDALKTSPHPKAPVTPATKIGHWIGSDVLAMRKMPIEQMQIARDFYNKIFDEQLCECPHIKKELKELGIDAKIVPLPTTNIYEEMPLPDKPTVAVYQPAGGMAKIYMPEFMQEIAKKMPDVNFIFYGDREKTGKKKNISYRGFVDKKGMKRLLKTLQFYLDSQSMMDYHLASQSL